MDAFEIELKNCFLDEALQITAETEPCLLKLEKNASDQMNIDQLLRNAHNLKGSSIAVGFPELGAFTHEIETLIIKIKKSEVKAASDVVNLLLRLNDFTSKMVRGLKENFAAHFEFQNLVDEIHLLSSQAKASAAAQSSEMTSQFENDENTEFNQEISNQIPLHFSPLAQAVQALGSSGDESIRVGLSKVEKLINYVGEMVIIQSVLQEQAQKSESQALKKALHMLAKVSKDIQDISMGLRMTPIKPTFQKMSRVVRDTAQSLSKQIEFSVFGEETELDKTVLEKINDPLVHLMRNSVDHGIESTEVRLAAGKPAAGKVSLKAFHRSGRLIIETSDDGGGMDPKRLISKAIEKGILKPGSQMSDKEALALIFKPGFSTKDVATDISGRGVGMDVVKTNLENLGGEIEITSEVGKGTSFRISLPLTLAIVESLIVSYSEQKFVIPLTHVFETIPTRDHTVQYATGVGEVILLRGENLRLFRLGDFFGIKSTKPNEDLIAIVIRSGTEPFALLVDDILTQSQVVVRQLSPDLAGFSAVSGATILGDGKPALILEPADLLKRKINHGSKPIRTHFEGNAA